MKKVLLVLVFVAIAAIFVAIGCRRKEESESKYRIAVIPKGTTHVFWKSIHAGAVKAEQELKQLGVEVIWKGPLKEDDREEQIKVVEGFITRGVSGIVLAPLDDVALLGPVKEAVNYGIPVVIIDSGLKSEDYVSFVATDNYIGGRKGGERLAEILGGKGKVVLLRYQEGSASTANRERGFLDVLKEKYPDIEVVSSNQYAGVSTESALRTAENLLSRFRRADGSSEIDGVFCATEPTTLGILRALQDTGYAGKITFIGFDSSKQMIAALRADELNGFVVQDPLKIGYLGVKTMVQHLRGEQVPRRIDTGSMLVTRQNLDTPQIHELLNPDLGKWLQ